MSETSISNELLAILVCPETKRPVSLASDSVLSQINSLVSQGKLFKKDGQQVKEKISAALLRDDSKILYPIIDGIPIMLVEEAIALES